MPFAPKPVPRPAPKPQAKRASSTARGYGHAHTKQRARLIRERPICQHCGEEWATDLHHIDGDPFNRSDANVLMVCEKCHHGKIHGGRA